MIKKVYWSSCKYPLFLSDVNGTRILLTDFRKYWNIKFHGKIYPLGSCGQTDRRRDLTKPIAAFHNFENTPKNRAGDNSKSEI
jgi:hypothetical protein